MLKKQYLIVQILKITFVFMAISLLSCKTHKQNVKPAIDDTKSNEQMEVPQQEEDKKEEALDALAKEILKKEKDDRKKRQMLLLKRDPVEKDW